MARKQELSAVSEHFGGRSDSWLGSSANMNLKGD